MSILTDKITKAINRGIPGDIPAIVAEVAKLEAVPQYPHTARPERNHDYRSPRCWCGENNHPSITGTKP